MRESRFTMSIDLPRPPSVVWPLLVDWENLGRWMKEATNFVVTSDHREGLGVTAKATIRISGFSTTDPVEVVGWDPPSFLAIAHLGWVRGKGLMHLSAIPAGTHLHWEEILIPPLGWPGALGLRILRPYMRWVFNRDLRLLRRLVESLPAG